LGVLLHEISDFFVSTGIVTMLSVAKLLSLMAVVLHYIACGWYLMGKESGEPSETWIGEWQGLTNPDFYLVSFHWAIAQFTPAPISIGPKNRLERLFNVGMIFMGVAVVSSIVGSLTALISQSRQKSYQRIVEEETLRKFLIANNISQELARRIQYHSKQRHSRKKFVTEDMIPVLSTLPDYLRRDMRYEVNMNILSFAPFFIGLNDAQVVAVRILCDVGVKNSPVDKGSVPFYTNTPCSSVYFISTGQFTYSPDSSIGVHALEVAQRELQHGDYLSEAVLWCKWEHQGMLEAASVGSMQIISHKTFGQIMAEHYEAHQFCCEYASRFLRKMTQQVNTHSNLDDLFHPEISFLDEALDRRVVEMSSSRRRSLMSSGSVAQERINQTRSGRSETEQ